MDSRHEPNILELERATGRPHARVADAHRLWAISSDSRRRWGGFVELAVPRSPMLDGAGNGTSAYLLRKSAPAAVGMLRSTEPLKETRSSRVSQRLPLLGERATGRPRICFANPHRLQAPAGAFACSLQTLRVCFTLAPCRVRVPALDSKKHGTVMVPCLCS
jgi:hypothetical protein